MPWWAIGSTSHRGDRWNEAMAGRASLAGTCEFDFQPVSPTTLPGQACDGLGISTTQKKDT